MKKFFVAVLLSLVPVLSFAQVYFSIQNLPIVTYVPPPPPVYVPQERFRHHGHDHYSYRGQRSDGMIYGRPVYGSGYVYGRPVYGGGEVRGAPVYGSPVPSGGYIYGRPVYGHW